MQYQLDIKPGLEEFIEQVCTQRRVWVLENRGCVAGCPATRQELNYEADVFPVFSAASRAVSGAAYWNNIYPPVAVSLTEYMHKVLPYLSEFGLLVGPNWGHGMTGLELPAQLVLDRLEAVLQNNVPRLVVAV